MSKVAFIGAGNMSKAIIVGLIEQGFSASNIMVSNPSAPKREALAKQYGLKHTDDNIEAANFCDTIVLSVKPHLIKQVCQQLASKIDISNKCFISLAAGITIEQIQSALAQQAPVVRCMPNTPSQVGLGMTGMFASSEVTQVQHQFSNDLLAAVGKVMWLESEAKIDDLLTASGSGPAYFFAFMEAMQKQALAFGFSQEEARELIQQTAIGAATMVVENADTDIATLRENVTSKGGTTQAALKVFSDGKLDDLVSRAMIRAKARSIEISESN
ncbi:pyrroline-5-carboxylate reductase [Thalassomonas sp. M1454]|uniref:pyrroline-5-carboxylate reductase n=1 Tax=Thalassomonas sp. M1454 TaxID=2594477 RepID=UPI00117EF9B1|nr:pyrroline-5-carboxylate reductase [Thalassomonas sp. M1454]TRX55838.1 pyrroline-5-carboxylate reductase [Thalassomonas sp. M1454]